MLSQARAAHNGLADDDVFFPVRPLSQSSRISIIQDAGQLTFANRAIIIFGFHENPDIRTN
jgi:hypothetical protein